jgi:hypothetical protein
MVACLAIAHATPPIKAQQSDAYELVNVAIDTFSLASEGRKTIAETADQSTGEPLAQILEAMTATRIAIGKLEQARRLLMPISDGATDGTVREAAIALSGVYEVLIQELNRSLELDQKLAGAQNRSDLVRLLDEASQNMATMIETWKLLLTSAVLMTHVLVDNERLDDGRLSYLRISTRQKGDLLQKLEILFGAGVRQLEAGQYPPDAAASLLWSFLNQEWKTADTP